MNDSPNYAEYAVAQKAEGKWRTRRIILVTVYVLFSVVWLVGMVGILKIWPLGMFTPVLTWMLVFFTWRFVAVDHEYIIVSGVITFTDILGGRSRKKRLEYTIKNMTKIAPMTDEYRAEYADAAVRYDFRGSVGSPDAYFFTFRDDAGKKAVVFFEATAKALKVMRFYNPGATVMSTTLRY